MSINGEKPFEKNPTPIHEKKLSNLGKERNFLKLMESMCQKKVFILHQTRKTEYFPSKNQLPFCVLGMNI